jgi:hypothetical protein
MINLKYTYEMDGDFFVGYLDDYPEFPTQGENFEDFEKNLLDIYEMIQDGTLDVPHITKSYFFCLPDGVFFVVFSYSSNLCSCSMIKS